MKICMKMKKCNINNMNMMDMLRFTNQKDSASKIYPGLSYMYGKGGLKD